MKSNEDKATVNRRAFLRGLGVTAAAVPAAALAVGSQPAQAAEAGAAPAGDGYRETDHVRRAYDAARF